MVGTRWYKLVQGLVQALSNRKSYLTNDLCSWYKWYKHLGIAAYTPSHHPTPPSRFLLTRKRGNLHVPLVPDYATIYYYSTYGNALLVPCLYHACTTSTLLVP